MFIKIDNEFKPLQNCPKNRQSDEPLSKQRKFGKLQTFPPDLSTDSVDRIPLAKRLPTVQPETRIGGLSTGLLGRAN